MAPRAGRPHMPGYGVPDDLAGALPWSWAQERLVGCRNYWVVTASARARPHAMPVWGVWLADRERFVFSSSPGARKARNLAENPQASVAVDDTVECVVVEGTVAAAAGTDAGAAAIEAYVTKYAEPDGRATLAEFIGINALWMLVPERAFAVIEREEEFGPKATKWTW